MFRRGLCFSVLFIVLFSFLIFVQPYFVWASNFYELGSAPVEAAASSTWYFAEGYTGSGFHEYICLQNPNGSPANVTIEYMYRGGGGTTQYLRVGPATRETVYVNGVVGPNKEVSAKVTSDQFIIAERPMYFNFNGINGGHNVVGSTGTSNIWYFAEGYTGSGFKEYLTLQNPNPNPATISICYMNRNG